MDIRIQSTPNPNALKYILPDSRFAQPRSFPSAESAAQDPLASRLFGLGGIYNVFMVRDFITVNKEPHASWEPLREEIAAVIARYFES